MSSKPVERPLVTIYEDPITREIVEGQALIVVEYGEFDSDGNKLCSVIFDGLKGQRDGEPLVTRRVYRSELEKAGYV